MEKSILGEENHQASNSDLVSKSVGSSIKIDSISIDLVGNDKTDHTGKCEHFSIRGFVSEVRKKNWNLCWPFTLDGNDNKPVEETCALPPLHVSKFRWWRCQNCLQEMYSERNTYNCGNGSNYCSNTRFKSSETCSYVSSLGDAAMLQSEFEQAPNLNIVDGRKGDARIATDLNVNDCHRSLDNHKNGKKSGVTNTPITGHEIGQEYVMNQENPVSASAATGVTPGLMMGRHHTVEIVALKTNCDGSVEFSKPGSESHEAADKELANGKLKCVFKNPAEVFQTGKQPCAEEQHSKLMIACDTARVVNMVEDVVDGAKVLTVEHSYPELDECDNVSYESDETLSENCLQDHHHDNSSNSHRRKTRKVRLLTELLAENGNAKANLTMTENSLSCSIPNSSAGTDVVSGTQGLVAFQGNAIRVLDQNKKRKLPHDEEQGPTEISSPINFYKITRTCNGSAETTGELVSLDAKESTGIDLQIGVKSNLNKFRVDRSPTCRKKNKSLVVDEFLSLAPSGEKIPEDIRNRTELDANEVSAADAIPLKSAETAIMSRGMYPFPLPPQKTERNSSICKKKSKLPQFDGGQTSLPPWSSGILREGTITRKDVETNQLNSIISPFESSQAAATGKGLHLSLNSCFSAQGHDNKYISLVEHRQLPWQACSSNENGVMGKDIQRNYVGNSDYPSKSEVDTFLWKGVHCDLSRDNYRMSFLNQKQKSSSQVEAGGHSLMQPMDFYGRGNNGKSIEMRGQALTTKCSDQQADKVSEQGVPDDIPMEIVELMAKNQYERCLPDVENEKPVETTINTSNVPIFAKEKLSLLSDEAAHKPKSRAKNGRNGKIARTENGVTSKLKSDECFSHAGRKHFNMNPLEQPYGPAPFLPFSQCQGKAPNGIKFSGKSSGKHSSSQNCQWIESILGQRSSQTNLQTLGARNSYQNVPQQSKEAAHLWSSMIPGRVPFIYDIPQKHAIHTNADILSHCSSLHNGNVNGNHNLNFLSVDVTNIEKHSRTFDSESLSGPHAEYPFTCKNSGMGSLDLYSNETIPAMHLLSLMDAGLPSGPPLDIDGNHKFLKGPPFPHDHHSKDFSGLSSGGYKTTSTLKPLPYDYYGKNHLSDKTQECFPAIQTAGVSGFSFQHDKVVKKTTGFTGQVSMKSQGRGKAKASDSPSRIKESRSQQSLFITGGSGTSHGSIPVHSMQKMFLGTSDSVAFPLRFHVMETATKHKSEAHNIASTVLPPKSSIRTEICGVNRNPADFTMPEAGNIYMITGEDLKCRKPVFSESICGSIKLDGRKRQKKLISMKGKV